MALIDSSLPEFLNIDSMRKSIDEFLSIYKERPIKDNGGGMGINHSWALWYIVRNLEPKIVVESGVWKGHSTWLIENAYPEAKIYCFDINFANLEFISTNATYIENDFTSFDWSNLDKENGLCFFDDHQNALERMKSARWFGFKNIIIEDNWPVNEGDCYSIRHMSQGVGFPDLQMSKMYLGTHMQKRQRAKFKNQLMRFYNQQTRIVKPNDTDFLNFMENVVISEEMNPLFLEECNNWGLAYTGEYATKQELLKNRPLIGSDYSYSYITYVKLK
jgi:hypothetical protein